MLIYIGYKDGFGTIITQRDENYIIYFCVIGIIYFLTIFLILLKDHKPYGDEE